MFFSKRFVDISGDWVQPGQKVPPGYPERSVAEYVKRGYIVEAAPANAETAPPAPANPKKVSKGAGGKQNSAA